MQRKVWILALAASLGCAGLPGRSRVPGEAPRFDPLPNGIVRDTRSALLWTARDSAAELPWPAADARCRSLVLGSEGSTGWRLPTREELAALYDESHVQACGADRCRVDPVIDLSSPYQWASTARGTQADRRVYLDFRYGSELAPLLRPTLTRRALCVSERVSGSR
jgi:hypothetical protein